MLLEEEAYQRILNFLDRFSISKGMKNRMYALETPSIMRLAGALVCAGVVLMGCTHTRPFDPASADARREVNRRAGQERVILLLADENQAPADSAQIGREVTTWRDPVTGEIESLATSKVAAVRFRDRGRGLLEGLGIGALIGVGAGVVLGIVASATDDSLIITPAEAALLGSIYLGGLGGGIGALAGLDRGSWIEYELRRSPESLSR